VCRIFQRVSAGDLGIVPLSGCGGNPLETPPKWSGKSREGAAAIGSLPSGIALTGTEMGGSLLRQSGLAETFEKVGSVFGPIPRRALADKKGGRGDRHRFSERFLCCLDAA
jgi:hypothetical protein